MIDEILETLATKMHLKPRHDKVVVKADEQDEKTDGGLYIPDVAKKHVDKTGGTGTILAVSELGWIDDLGVRHVTDLVPGQKIVFTAHSGMWIKHKGKKYMFIAEKDILATIEEG